METEDVWTLKQTKSWILDFPPYTLQNCPKSLPESSVNFQSPDKLHPVFKRTQEYKFMLGILDF